MDKWMLLQYKLATPEERIKNGWTKKRESPWKGTHRTGWKNKQPFLKPYWNPEPLTSTAKKRMEVALDKIIDILRGKNEVVWLDGICYNVGE